MRVPLSLLLSYCDPGLSPEEIASVLALTGTEVERIRRIGVPNPDGFVVGRIVEAVQHPDADRLRVCSVDVGADEPAQIVCGAPNAAAGLTVAVALPGAVMPGGMKIKKAKLRGVDSSGMICSEEELELGTGGEGILELPEGFAAAGTALADVLPLSETVLDLEITPNRPDCLGVYGVARELHAATGAELAAPPWEVDLGSSGAVEGVAVTVEAPGLCPRFTARVYSGLGSGETPVEVKAHLHAAGIRSISPIVDITNYTMLLVGEPLHAFDLDRIDGARLTVREATAGETVVTLDGQERKLEAGDPVICDATGTTSIAGVMGGARSEVEAGTTRVLLEAAVWNGPVINGVSTRLALRSEASGRFEKGLAPVLAGRGQAFASTLFERFFGVRPEAGTIDVSSGAAEPEAIRLPRGKATGLLGYDVSDDRISEVLGRLGFEVSSDAEALTVVAPAERLDVVRAVDLIEEIARIDGLDQIPAKLPTGGGAGRLNTRQKLRRKLVDSLASQGLYEMAGWSFASPSSPDKLRLGSADTRRVCVTIANPMSEEESKLRTTLLPTVLDSAARNVARGNRNVRLFEVGPVYLPAEDGLTNEPLRACGVLIGDATKAGWRVNPSQVDVFAGIAVVSEALAAVGVALEFRAPTAPEPFLHPGRSADVVIGNETLGWVGELHPLVAAEWDTDGAVVFELDVEAVIAAAPGTIAYSGVSAQPAVLQDLAVVVPNTTAAGDLVDVARKAGGKELESVEVFDVYSGEQVGIGNVSIGLRLAFRVADRTLTEEEASVIRNRILAAITEHAGGQARV